MQSRRYCFTLNNPDEKEIDSVRSYAVSPSGPVTLICVGLERAPTTGTPHLQGYIEFSRKIRRKGINRHCPFLRRAAVFVAKGTAQDNRTYCSKEGNLIIDAGEAIVSGQRTDLDAVRRSIDEGHSTLEVAQQHFPLWVRYRKSFEVYSDLIQQKAQERRIDLQVSVFVGAPGTGKTRWVFDNEPEVWSFFGSGGSLWFDGYTGQPAVLFDDFDPQCFSYEILLRLLDIYPMRVPVKGGFVWWKPKRVFITSNHPLSSWYPGRDIGALLRRITEHRDF